MYSILSNCCSTVNNTDPTTCPGKSAAQVTLIVLGALLVVASLVAIGPLYRTFSHYSLSLLGGAAIGLVLIFLGLKDKLTNSQGTLARLPEETALQIPSYANQLLNIVKNDAATMRWELSDPLINATIYLKIDSVQISADFTNNKLTLEEMHRFLTQKFAQAESHLFTISCIVIRKTEHEQAYFDAIRILRKDNRIFSANFHFEGKHNPKSFEDCIHRYLQPLELTEGKEQILLRN